MRLLAVDVGTGTQDILVFDTDRAIENCFKMVMPSPTVLVADAIREATRAGDDLLLTGVTMGGGPCHWAANAHLDAGHRIFATPDAARTFDDDLSRIEEMGVRVVGDDQALALTDVRHIEMRDFYYDAILQAMGAFQTDLELDALAVAVFDHGAAPPGYSDRRFRFDYLADHLQEDGDLASFGFWRGEIPERFTRLQAVADSIDVDLPLMVMDTGPAAVLGALEDERVRSQDPTVVANIGNFHTLAFHLTDGRIAGVFEHHTGEITREGLERYLRRLARGEITNDEVFEDMGHGALVFFEAAGEPEFFAITGPRRRMIEGSALPTYRAVPHGDMMLTGCFGLVRAYAHKDAERGEEIAAVLDGTAEPQDLW